MGAKLHGDNQNPNLAWNFMTHRFLHPSASLSLKANNVLAQGPDRPDEGFFVVTYHIICHAERLQWLTNVFYLFITLFRFESCIATTVKLGKQL